MTHIILASPDYDISWLPVNNRPQLIQQSPVGAFARLARLACFLVGAVGLLCVSTPWFFNDIGVGA